MSFKLIVLWSDFTFQSVIGCCCYYFIQTKKSCYTSMSGIERVYLQKTKKNDFFCFSNVLNTTENKRVNKQ